MFEPPAGLLARFDDGSAFVHLVDRLTAAYSDQYARERRSFDPIEGDDGFTFGTNIRQHGWARVVERAEHIPGVTLRKSGVVQSITFEEVTIRPYKLGYYAPANVDLERFDAKSAIRQLAMLDNEAQVQMALDINGAINAPEVDPERRFSPNQLVLAHYGNPDTGREAIFLGAPLDELRDGSYWQWLHQLAGTQDAAAEDDGFGLSSVLGPGPTSPAPYSEGSEPEIPIERHEDEDELPGER